MYQQRFDEIINYFNEYHHDALTEAREEFYSRTGEIFEDDPFFENRIMNYLEWFLFDRIFEGNDTAIAHYKKKLGPELSKEDRETVDAFCYSIHSLFEVRRSVQKKQKVILRNLTDNIKYEVSERRSLAGLEKGSIFEARLIQKGDKFLFLQAFVHHPAEARKIIRKTVKKMLKENVEDFGPYFMTLQKAWMQCQRYSHVNAARIYAEENPEKLHAR